MNSSRVTAALACVFIVLATAVSPGFAAAPTPLARAHAHNDYLHERPLQDALDRGFMSVEADIWLVGDDLLVAHDFEDIDPDRTLESLYLDPLLQRVRGNGGEVYDGSPHYLTLLIDIKSEAVSTYLELHRTLRRYRQILTTFTPGGVDVRSVTAIVSGNRTREVMQAQRVRYAGYDGRLGDLGGGDPADLIPLISDNWTSHFTWTGEGPIPEDELAELNRIVETAHANGQRVRFWATPDAPGEARTALWQVLLDAGVDHLNTDDLAGLQEFLLTHDPDPSTPHVGLTGTALE